VITLAIIVPIGMIVGWAVEDIKASKETEQPA
jgi:hypothetical protein